MPIRRRFFADIESISYQYPLVEALVSKTFTFDFRLQHSCSFVCLLISTKIRAVNMKLLLASLVAGAAAFAPAQQGASSSAIKEFAGGMVGGEYL